MCGHSQHVTRDGGVHSTYLSFLDRETGRSKGFAFVSFASKDECEKAMGLDGAGLGRRTLKINFVN